MNQTVRVGAGNKTWEKPEIIMFALFSDIAIAGFQLPTDNNISLLPLINLLQRNIPHLSFIVELINVLADKVVYVIKNMLLY